MNENSLAMLRQLLLLRYNDFKSRLTRRLGSADLAGDALQDTWLRLEDTGHIAAVHRPDNYLFRIALNIARDRQRAETRRLTTGEIDELLNIGDDEPNPAQVAEARSELLALETIMLELPPRQRAILLAARLDGMARRDIARRYRISVRLVQRELQEAQDYCAARLKRWTTERFTSGPRETSPDEKTVAGINRLAVEDEE
jgi:RNA polymerase sigma factor (sigma-70 family)